MEKKVNTERLIAQYLLGDLTSPEKEQLENWIKSSPQHEEFFNHLRTNTSFRKRYETYTQINSHQAWQYFKKRYCQVSATSILLKYAAILILPIIITAGGWYFYTASEKQTSDYLALGDAIQPGIPKATLILAGNYKQSLTPTYPTPVKVNHSTTAIAQNGALIYPTTPNTAIDTILKRQNDAVENNTLTTEQGNEFRVTFEDGTTVHLNYNTELRYPVKFSQTKRIVYLKGEAYFKIAKDHRPFYVITDQGAIKQYGTEFNVNTFTPECTEVALVKGSISIIPKESNQEQFIKPGQLAHIEQKNNNISVHNVDLTPYIAWNEGRLIFENRTLENIVEILEHWYNVDISFGTPELKQLRFTGNMDRYATISPILKAIARTTNLRIKIEGREILITDN
ncbi:FecR family protein [Bacteroides sp. AN502(2024)]|uniref:FecR family protein n=1 Tax=Bacteroides sp. AN502(2024) TaxID=3160599 RepID=UPI003519CBBD